MKKSLLPEYGFMLFMALNSRLRLTGKNASLKATFYSSLTNPSTRFVNALVYAAVAVFGSIAIIKTDALMVGELTCFLSYANQYTKPFNEISGVLTEFQNALACADRIKDLLNEAEIEEKEGAKTEPKGDFATIGFNDISFSYTENQKLIENFSLEVRRGKRIAIVGPTGCGKTTLINLLMRFYDLKSGKILMDNEEMKDYIRALAHMHNYQIRKDRLEAMSQKFEQQKEKYGELYCPCQLQQTKDTICPCRYMRTQGACRCGLFMPKEGADNWTTM